MRPLLIMCLTAVATTAVAQPAPEAPPGPRADSPHRFYVRAGFATVAPVTSSQEMELSDVTGPASLAVQNGPIAGSGATVDSATIPAAILGYVLPIASRRWSIETVLGVPFTVKFKATGTLANTSIAPTAVSMGFVTWASYANNTLTPAPT